MSLLSLPPEILCHIFRYVGPAYFKQDVGRLLVSRQWYTFTRWEFLRDVTLHPGSLRQLILLHESSPETVASSLDCLEKLSIKIYGQEGVESGARRHGYAVALNADLVRLGPLVRRAARLKELHIRASRWVSRWASQWAYPNEVEHPVAYLFVRSVLALLDVPDRLEVLVLDITTRLRPQPDVHICDVLQQLLPILRVLHVRLPTICRCVLMLPLDNFFDDLKLEEVVINTSLKETDNARSSENVSADHAQPCYDCVDILPVRLAEIDQEGVYLLRQMVRNKKKVRIIKHCLATLQLISMDVETEADMELADDQAWGEDGELVKPPPTPEPSTSTPNV